MPGGLTLYPCDNPFMASNDPNGVPPMPRPFKIEDDPPAQQPPQDERQEAPRGAFTNTPGTMLVIAANVIVFGAMCATSAGQAFLDPSSAQLMNWGANYGPDTLGGAWWRLVTNTFVHGGIIHIGMNMYILSDIGRGVERMYGTSKFFVIYLLAGIGGSIVSIFANPNVLSVGASGAVFGCFGAFMVLLRNHSSSFDPNYLKSVWRSLITLLAFNLIYGFSRSGIDNFAHIGGFLSGILAGACVMPKRLGDRQWTAQDIGWSIFLLGMLGAAVYAESLNTATGTH
jgi:membrane associated rhomboid family serine protease